jgi:excinuclease ABC subunit B
MREAAADLNFEEAARLRDEVKRLRATELAVVDDPTAKQRVVQNKAGAYAGTKKYGEAANLPASAMKKKGGMRGASSSAKSGAPSSPSPLAGSEASEARSRGRGGGSTSRGLSKVHKPHLDEMHGPESLPFRPDAAKPQKPFGSASRVIQPTDSRQSGPEFGPTPRSSGGAPGHRGGWKKR